MKTLIVTTLLIGVATCSLRSVFRNSPLPLTGGDPGDPLFLTPLIEKGQFELAKNLSKVGPLVGYNVPSYTGYLTVNKTTESNLFFWFFPALENAATAPTLLWLQGGPGASSLFGLFIEHGPLYITKDMQAKFRNTTWATKFNMLYIDNPVGTGYSFTKSDDGYVTNEEEVGRDLFEALQQFFTLFSEYADNDFYATGESYGGKYVPAIAYTIYKNQGIAKMKLKGLAMGDGFTDPYTMLNYGDYLYQIGLIDQLQLNHFKSEEDKARKYIENEDYVNAFWTVNTLMDGDLVKTKSYFYNVTGMDFYLNYLYATQPEDFGYFNTYLQTETTRRAIHVGSLPYNDGSVTETHLIPDIYRSVKPWLAELMNHYKVLVYSGQLDIIVAYPLTVSFLNSIQWNGANDFSQVDRIIWKNKNTGEPAGYVRTVTNFTEVFVRSAGHILPYDQPENALDMIERFVYDKPFN